MNLEVIARCLSVYCRRADQLPLEGRERDVMPVGEPVLRVAQLLAELRAVEGETGFAELVEGEPVDRTIRGVEIEGPMFDLSPEDKAAGRNEQGDKLGPRRRRRKS